MSKPKVRIMVSGFGGYLALTDAQYKVLNPGIKKYAQEFLKYGEAREGYWTRDRFVAQMERAVQMAEIKYPTSSGLRHVWVFDHSSCHAAMADDVLDVNHMNVKPGGNSRSCRTQSTMGESRRCTPLSGERRYQRV